MRNGLLIKNSFFNKKKNKIENLKKIDLIIKSILSKTDNNIFHLLSKKFSLNFKTSNLKKFNKFKSVVVIGMGGSILGAKAIFSFLEDRIKKDFNFVDDLDPMILKKIKKINKKKVLFIIISKSGNTLETITNINLLAFSNFNEKNTIIITEAKNNALSNFAKKKKILIIKHRTYVGGRYSVLSEVGMVPAYFMGLDLKKFRKNLLKNIDGNSKKILSESVIKLAKNYKSKKINTIIFFNYSSKLNDLALWCQQLIAESLGKKNKGILPILSKAPKDHHSLLQLYLDGPKDKIFYVLSGKNSEDKKIKKNIFNDSFKYLTNKDMSKIIESQKNAFVQILKRKKIPHKEIRIGYFNEETLGEIFSYFILETAIIANLINVNPFNQPAVEQVKILTKRNLS
ncbi:glucose-6-phosphate isomerase [Pelagibacteraceae bacterium]|jgi:glucose-6-phosphate isomerase|nr:glucose-6-phosphate isomerase [Pelagibacteraceae bacterium]|tara:strand:+ start:7356 stop:8552 length:1197 start_codon:yes stop_codon:yes gene_type:complete